jgi:hypothetical protein
MLRGRQHGQHGRVVSVGSRTAFLVSSVSWTDCTPPRRSSSSGPSIGTFSFVRHDVRSSTNGERPEYDGATASPLRTLMRKAPLVVLNLPLSNSAKD